MKVAVNYDALFTYNKLVCVGEKNTQGEMKKREIQQEHKQGGAHHKGNRIRTEQCLRKFLQPLTPSVIRSLKKGALKRWAQRL